MNKNFLIASPTETNGTAFHGGYIYGSWNDVTDVLGEPINAYDEKVTYIWECKLANGTVFTVYDWHNSPSTRKSANVHWHIGTFSLEDTEKVVSELKKANLIAYVDNINNLFH